MLKRKDMLNLPIKFGAFTSQMREIEILFTKYNRIVVKDTNYYHNLLDAILSIYYLPHLFLSLIRGQ